MCFETLVPVLLTILCPYPLISGHMFYYEHKPSLLFKIFFKGGLKPFRATLYTMHSKPELKYKQTKTTSPCTSTISIYINTSGYAPRGL